MTAGEVCRQVVIAKLDASLAIAWDPPASDRQRDRRTRRHPDV
jgi:hypothetical protein